MSDKALRRHLIRTAKQMPAGSESRRHLLALLAGSPDAPGAEMLKMAADTGDFATWVLTTTQGSAISSSEVKSFVKGLGVNVGGKRSKRPGARWQVGDRVCVKADKHKGDGIEVYKKYDRKMGVVVDEGDGSKGAAITVRIGGAEVVFPNAQRSRYVGMGKATDWSKFKGKGPVEIIYKADPSRQPPREQQQIAAEYIERGDATGQRRSLNYYSGFILSAADGSNGFYMSIMAQQRISADPCDEFFGIRSFNPDKGQVLYIGRLGKRPKGWEQELEQIRAGGM